MLGGLWVCPISVWREGVAMRIVTLIENTSCQASLCCEHGLSLYIETGKHRILFDAGQTGAFADNAEKLGIDLRTVDLAVLSHGHYDHGGGLKRFLEINHTAPVYLSRNAFGAYYNGTQKYIGLDSAMMDSSRFVFVDDRMELTEGITLHSCNDRRCAYPIESYGLNTLEDGCFLPDSFRHEQYLLVEEAGKTVCFSGCSHKGILNIAQWFQPDVLVGGFHFVKLDPQGSGGEILEKAAKQLLEYPTVYYTGHCTGNAQFAFLKERMGNRLNPLSTGSVIEI